MNSKPVIQAIGLNDATDLLIETNDVLILSPSTFLSFYATKPVRTNKMLILTLIIIWITIKFQRESIDQAI